MKKRFKVLSRRGYDNHWIAVFERGKWYWVRELTDQEELTYRLKRVGNAVYHGTGTSVMVEPIKGFFKGLFG